MKRNDNAQAVVGDVGTFIDDGRLWLVAATPRKIVTLYIAGSKVIFNTWERKTLRGNTDHHRHSM
jgi:hypothetical protein